MSKKPETLFKEKFVRELKRIDGLKVFKIQQSTICGTPDLLICLRGLFIAIELKKDEREAPTPLQQHNLNEIAQCGGVTFVACPENSKQVISALLKIKRYDLRKPC